DAVVVRSHDMHAMSIPGSRKAVARAGAGVNNIPVARLSALGIPVFNTPGANANAVKELVLAGMLLGARNICQAWSYARELRLEGDALTFEIEKAKRRFSGLELPGRRLAIIGLGAVGVEVANAALVLGMRVRGYDPDMTVQRAWQLSSSVERAATLGDALSGAEFISVHVPLSDATRHLIGAERLRTVARHAVLLNFSRSGIVDEEALLSALEARALHAYVCDFPTARIKDHPNVIALPHIGASTKEAQDNCAMMAAERLREFLEEGNVRSSVNFPEVVMPRANDGEDAMTVASDGDPDGGGSRLVVVNANVPNMLGQISSTIARDGLNIVDMLNKSRGEVAYTLTDLSKPIGSETLAQLAAIDGVLSVRAI
ncbi:MAG: phosphoglycerate dehydrogenase, partial [Gammaproteobacteria bacterium]